MDFAECSDFRDILRGYFRERKERNPSYSLRAYARDLDLSPSRLSEVMNKGLTISVAKAEGIAGRLGLKSDESRYFVDLAILDAGTNPVQVELAKSRIDRYQDVARAHTLAEAEFEIIAEWYHLAIVELSKLQDFELSPEWIGERLALSPGTVTHALANLERVGLIEFDDEGFTVHRDRNFVSSPVPSQSIRRFHRQILEKAKAALNEQDLEERELASVMVAIDREQLPAIKEKLKLARRQFISEVKAMTETPDAVYTLSVQWFRLAPGKTKG